MLYRDSLTTHQYLPDIPTTLEHIRNERQWLLVNSGKDKIAFLHTYIACQNNRDDSFLSWNEDLFFLLTQEATRLKQQGFTILAMGDFNSRVGAIAGLENNTPDHNQNTPLFFNFLNEVNLLIINTLPKNLTDSFTACTSSAECTFSAKCTFGARCILSTECFCRCEASLSLHILDSLTDCLTHI